MKGYIRSLTLRCVLLATVAIGISNAQSAPTDPPVIDHPPRASSASGVVDQLKTAREAVVKAHNEALEVVTETSKALGGDLSPPAPSPTVDPKVDPQPGPEPTVPVIQMPPTVTIPVNSVVHIGVISNCDITDFEVVGNVNVIREWSSNPKDINLAVWGFQEGTGTLLADGWLNGKSTKFQRCVITIGQGPTPIPPGPTPPIPPNPPVPPEPTPGPFSALMVYEAGDLGKPEYASYLSGLNSTLVTDYLNTHCAKDAKGIPAWRKWDKDVVITADEDIQWTTDLNKAKKDHPPVSGQTYTPWLILSNEAGATASVPLPSTPSDILTLLKKWGGN